jgi:hypothetical protein
MRLDFGQANAQIVPVSTDEYGWTPSDKLIIFRQHIAASRQSYYWVLDLIIFVLLYNCL